MSGFTEEEMREAWKQTKKDLKITIYPGGGASWKTSTPTLSNSWVAELHAKWIFEMEERWG